MIKPVDRDRLAVLIEKHRVARSSLFTDGEAFPLPRRDASPKKERGRSKGRQSEAIIKIMAHITSFYGWRTIGGRTIEFVIARRK